MSIYARYKRDPEGFRKLVELMESSPKERRDKMVEAGMKEDPEYTKKALTYLITFDDVVGLPEAELAELVATATPRITATSIANQTKEIQNRFLRCARGANASEIRDLLETEHPLREIGGARLKMISITRQLEQKGLVNVKRLPT